MVQQVSGRPPMSGTCHVDGARGLSFRKLKEFDLSVAFTKEESAETAAETLLPDRLVSPHPNLVTEAGLKALEAQPSGPGGLRNGRED